MMAKKKDLQPAQPVISSLPISASDSPLVIDLPDGQKLVVGKMEAGTVIEVATWRGTGRPDSRTSRLMLGMSSGSTPTPGVSTEDASSTTQKPQGKLAVFQMGSSLLLQKVMTFMGFTKQEPSIKAPKPSKFKVSKPKLKFPAKKQDALEDPDFQNWLDSVTKKNQKLSSFSIDSDNSQGKIGDTKEVKEAPSIPKKAPAKPVAKKATSKARR